MNIDKILRNVALGAGALHFNVGSPMSMAAALVVNQHLPLVITENNFEFLTKWSTELLPAAKQEIADLAKYMCIDETLALEMTRLVYQHRCFIARDPLYILFEILTPHNYVEVVRKENRLYREEHVYHQAFYYIIETVFSNRREIMTYFSDMNYMRSSEHKTNMLTDRIYDTLERTLKDVPAEVMRSYHAVIRSVVHDMLEMYRCNAKFEMIFEKRFHPLVENQLVSAMQGTITQQQRAAFINAFYAKEILDRTDVYHADKDLEKAFSNAHADESMDTESFGADEFDIESYEANLDAEFAKVHKCEELMRTMLQEGTTRADVITFCDKHPVKDFDYLSQFPLQREGTVHPDAVMGLFAGLKKVGRGLIRMTVRLIEAIITNISKLFAAPFDFKPRFVITDKSDMAEKWGRTFNKPIHGLIEKKLPVIQEERLAPDAIRSALSHVSEYIALFESFSGEAENAYRDSDKERLEQINDELNRRGLEIASGFDTMMNLSGVFTKLIENPASGVNLSAENGQAPNKSGELSSYQNAVNAKNVVTQANTQGHGARQTDELDIAALMEMFPEIEKIEQSADTLEKASGEIARRVKRVGSMNFSFLKEDRDDVEALEQEQVLRESFLVHNETLKRMATTTNMVAIMYRRLMQEVVTMKVTWQQVECK